MTKEHPYIIRQPIWNGGKAKIGIADFRLKDSDLYVKVDYTNKAGERSFPHLYFMKRDEALQYPRQRMKNVTLILIPIDDLNVIQEITNENSR